MSIRKQGCAFLKNSVLLSAFLLSTEASASLLQQECDGEVKTCCFAKGFNNVPPMWIGEPSCPGGMGNADKCEIQYGCKKIEAPAPETN